jgi:hypothetical protein
MTDRELQEFISAGRMTDLMTANDNVFKDTAKAIELKEALLTDIAVLEAAGAARVSASGLRTDGTMDSRAGKSALEKFVRKLASNGKTIKNAEPDFENIFKIPKGSLSNQELLDVALSFRNDLTPAAVGKFSQYGFTAATPANLDAKISAFQTGRAQQNTGKGSGVAATAATRAASKRLKANRRTLRDIGANILEEHGDAGLIAEWKSACRIERPKPAPKPETPPNA